MSTIDNETSPEIELLNLGDAVLAHLAEALQLEKLSFDDNQECVVTIDEKYVALMYLDAQDTRSIIINIPLGYLPKNSQREPLLLKLMSGNYCWSLTEGGTLGVDQSTNQISLCYLVPLPLPDAADIVGIMQKLVAVSNYWMGKITEACTEGVQNNSVPYQNPMSEMMMLRI